MSIDIPTDLPITECPSCLAPPYQLHLEWQQAESLYASKADRWTWTIGFDCRVANRGEKARVVVSTNQHLTWKRTCPLAFEKAQELRLTIADISQAIAKEVSS